MVTIQKSSPIVQWGLSLGGLLALFVAWELVSGVFGIYSEHVLPAPSVIIATIFQVHEILLNNLWRTMLSAGIGYVAAVILGILTAVALTINDRFNEFVLPIIVGGNSVPRIALAPLIIFYTGIASTAHILIAAWIAYFPIVINTVDGLENWNESERYLLRSLGATRWQEYKYMRFYKALPHIFDGLKVGATLAVVGAVVGEFVAAGKGMGYLALVALYNFQIPLTFAVVTLMALVSTAVFLFLYVLQDRLVHWTDTSLIPK